MYRTNADYKHRPYKKELSHSDIFFTGAKWLVIIATVAYYSAWFTNQKFFQFDYVNVYGVHSVDVKEIEDIARAPLSKKVLFFWRLDNREYYPTGKILKEISSYSSRFKNVSVVLNRKNVNVYITEYEPKMRYCLTPLTREDSNVLMIKENTNTLSSGTSTALESIATTTNDGFVIVPKKGEEELGLREIPLTEEVDNRSHDCYWADDNGYVFAKSPQYSGLPIFTVIESDPVLAKTLVQENSPIGKNIFNKTKFENIKAIVGGLGDAGLNVKQVENLTNDDVAFDVGFPWVVVMNTKRSPEDSVDNLLLALKELKVSSSTVESRIKQIDVRFGNKVFYK